MEKDNRYLCFNLGEEEYAIPLLDVREVIAMPEVTPVPQMPFFHLGIMNLRGQVISILDLRKKLKIEPKQNAETAVIICDFESIILGLVVDSINSVFQPKPEQITDDFSVLGQNQVDFIDGVFKRDGKLTFLINLKKFLGIVEEKSVNTAA